MDVLSSRLILRPADTARSQAFYRDTLGLAVYREFGDPDHPGIVFFVGGGYLEVSGSGTGGHQANMMLWLQVRDVAETYQRLSERGVNVLSPPATTPWGLVEMWIADPDGTRIVLVEVPADHPMRRDLRTGIVADLGAAR